MQVIILTSGQATKIWPYNSIRKKAFIPISNIPLIKILVGYLNEYSCEIIISCDSYINSFRNILDEYNQITYVEQESKGSADSLLKLKEKINLSEPFVVLFGDVYYSKEDIYQLLHEEINSVLIDLLNEPSKNWIACKIKHDFIQEIGGHFRNEELKYRILGGKFSSSFFEYLKKNPGYFKNVRVGVSSPNEYFMEQSLLDMIENGTRLHAVRTKGISIDMDKPWHVLEINEYHNKLMCNRLLESNVHKTVDIDNSAQIKGQISIEEFSKIGKNCVIEGNVIIGKNTIIDNGVIIGSNVVIGDDCIINNNVKIGDNTTIGNKCKISNSFELLGGIFFEHVHAVHYGLFYGIVGESSDFGAGTTVGDLRFDDQVREQ